ncbi:transcriptional regulator, MarR family [Pseudonocardia sp. N23]|nr:transcriptional regulator, MarR family [Pseudonocardia sp. N23]
MTPVEAGSVDVPGNPVSEDVAELAGRLRIALSRLTHALRAPDDEVGLTPTRIATLSILETAGPLRVGALAERIGISPPTMTRLVDCLAELDLVRRDPDPDDQRATRVSLSDGGGALLERLRHRGTGLLARRIAGLDTAGLVTLAAAVPLLEDLAEAVVAH